MNASRILVLTFHAVGRDLRPSAPRNRASARYAVAQSLFAQVLEHVSADGAVTARDILAGVQGRCVVLTFDDGLRSDYDAVFPLLQEKRLPGVFFVSAANVGAPGYTDARQLCAMAAAGMEIASHGCRHEYLIAMPRRDAVREIAESKDRLEQLVEQEVVSFAPVGGHFRRWMVAAAAEAGYRVFATMVPGVSTTGGSPLVLRRNHVLSSHDARYAARLLRGEKTLLSHNRLRYEALRAAKGLLGMRNYDRGKQLLTRWKVVS
ncbi:MAG: polysaccharide deacetylase family protein [Planctomycetes bacterium]|nr:polysaccharide deacetylase family protein [Planctomycetota bacterium]